MTAASDAVASGYSGTPLAKKLGVVAGMRVAVLDAPAEHAPPAGYARLLAPLPDDVRLATSRRGSDHLVHLFVTPRARLDARIDACRRAIFPAGTIWVSWPKRASGVATDVTEDVIRELALARGLVDVKVCAVDATWSGLKLVVPVAQRG
jgi:hypothetical protein